MLHVVIITPVFAINEKDTISVPFLQIFCRELINRGASLTVICEQYPDGDNYQWQGIQVITLKRKIPRLAYKFLRKKIFHAALRQLHKTKPFQVIHNIWFNVLGELSEQFALKNKIKHITTLAGQDVLNSNKFLKNILEYSGTLVCPSEFQKQKLLSVYSVDVEIIPWGIEDVVITGVDRDIDLITCGWINSVKNYPLFLEIVKELQHSQNLRKVVICGGGPLLNDLIQDVKSSGLDKLIEIKKGIPREQVLELMQRSKLLIHTSHFESFGLVLAEALACNCTVISRPVGIAFDNKDIIQCNTSQEFVVEIKRSLETYSNSKKTVVNFYPIHKTVSEYLRIYSGT